jgi:hypothetical protein
MRFHQSDNRLPPFPAYNTNVRHTTQARGTIVVTCERDHAERPCIVVITMGQSNGHTKAFLDKARRIAADHICSLKTIEVKGNSTEPIDLRRDDVPEDAFVFLVDTNADKTQANKLRDTLNAEGITISQNAPLDPSKHLFALEDLSDLLLKPLNLLPSFGHVEDMARQANFPPPVLPIESSFQPPPFNTHPDVPSIQDFFEGRLEPGEDLGKSIQDWIKNQRS